MPYFEAGGLKLYYETEGSGPAVLFLHGLLHRNWMQHRLARLAASSFRSISLEFSGHGRSDSPRDPSHYSLKRFAFEANACLEHLGVDGAVVHGTSLGANVALEMLVDFPERLKGAVIEMPVLSASYGFARTLFEPLARTLEVGAPIISLLARALAVVPRINPELAIILDLVPKNPRQAAAVLWGLIEQTPKPDLDRFTKVAVPTLVIGHRKDPLHSFDDASRLASTIESARLIEAASMLELRLSPGRLWPQIEAFYRECLCEEGAGRISV
jgi:pimeloyl-ACP methyl ester carboxylesterase